MKDIVIIGAGTAGLTAAIYACRAGKTVDFVEYEAIGGQISTSPRVENYPGFESISGAAFSDALFEQATKLGAELHFGKVVSITDNGATKLVETDADETLEAKAVIIAGGVKHRHMGIDDEQAYMGKGVSYCAVCDGAFYKGKTVAVVGGGNTALQSAVLLAESCEKVYLVHRRDAFRAEKAVVEQLSKFPNIELQLSKTVKSLSGTPSLQEITLTDTKTGAESSLKADGLFVAIGQVPDNAIYADFVDLDAAGFIVADESCLTKTAGIFVAGDCRTKTVRQLTTAAADGSTAALAACNYINAL